MPTITLPAHWVLVMPCGCIDGVMRSTIRGEVTTPSAAIAWARFTRLKRDRDRERREGWVCRAGTPEDLESHKTPCPHAVPTSPDSGPNS